MFATLLAMIALRPLAVAVDLVDKPGGRKTHRGEVPVVGGLAMFLGIAFGLGLLPVNEFVTASLFSAGALVVLVGLLDDRFELSPHARLTAHLVAALLVLNSSELSIHSLGYPFGPVETTFSELGAAAFTVPLNSISDFETTSAAGDVGGMNWIDSIAISLFAALLKLSRIELMMPRQPARPATGRV